MEELLFIFNEAFDIPASIVGTAIANINVYSGVSGGTLPYVFSAENLPDGLSIHVATGVISGIPTTPQEAGTATLTVTDAAGESKSINIAYGAMIDKISPTLWAGSIFRTSDTEAIIGFTSDEGGKLYCVKFGWGTPMSPTREQMRAGTVLCEISAGVISEFPLTLTAGAWDIYFAVEDASGNMSAPLLLCVTEYLPITFNLVETRLTSPSAGYVGFTNISEACSMYYLMCNEGTPAPTNWQVMNKGINIGEAVFHTSGKYTLLAENIQMMTGAFDMYFVAVNEDGNISAALKILMGRVDITPPKLTEDIVTNRFIDCVTIKFRTSEQGVGYYLVHSTSATHPTKMQVKNGPGSVCMGTVSKNVSRDIILPTPDAWKVFVVVEDCSGNISDPLNLYIHAYIDKEAPTPGGSSGNRNITITNITRNSMKINWIPATDNITKQAELRYFVYKSDNTNMKLNKDELKTPNGINDTYYVAKDLEIEKEYFFKVKVVDEAGNISWYNKANAKTLYDNIPPVPGNFGTIYVNNIKHNELTLSWSLAKDDVTPQSGLKYFVYWQLGGASLQLNPNGSPTDCFLVKNEGEFNITQCVIKNLSEGTQYNFIVMVMDQRGNFACYKAVTATTLVDTGKGTESEPFKVRNYADLKKVGSGQDGWGLDKCYIQLNPINLADYYWNPIGTQKKPFTGTYNGNQKTISNLTIKNNDDYVGLFGVVAGSISNLRLSNVFITGNTYIGGIAGMLKEQGSIRGSISKCYVEVNRIHSNYCTDNGDAAPVGGITGCNNKGKISACIVTGRTVSGFNDVGGIAGANYGFLQDSYSTCRVIGNRVAGGIVGCNYEKNIDRCYATGYIEATCSKTPLGFAGGIAGYNRQKGVIQNCVALNQDVKANGGNLAFRIADGHNGATYKNNYARINLKCIDFNNSNSVFGAIAENIIRNVNTTTGGGGKDVESRNYQGNNSDVWWKNTAKFGSEWSFAKNQLPLLINV